MLTAHDCDRPSLPCRSLFARLRQTISTLQIPSRTSATDHLYPADPFSHDCDRPSLPCRYLLARLRQTISTLQKVFRTSATDHLYPAEGLSHVCDRPSLPCRRSFARLRQTDTRLYLYSPPEARQGFHRNSPRLAHSAYRGNERIHKPIEPHSGVQYGTPTTFLF